MSTFMAKAQEVERKWYVVDAQGKSLGRVATVVADLLRGKNEPIFTPHVDCGGHVIVINADKVVLTGKKLEQKYYRRHSGYIGGLKEVQYKTLMATKPEKAMEISKTTINRLFEELEAEGIEDFTFAPETTGKRAQLGNVSEVVELCATFDHFEPTIDFAHVHARGRGFLNKKEDYNCIFSIIEDNLDIDRLHCHFTTIEYSPGGEVKHHTLDESDEYGPNIKDLLSNLIDNGWKANIICETPERDLDSLKMKKIYEDMI